MASILDLSASSDSEDDVDYIPSTNVAASDSSFDEDVTDDESGELCSKTSKITKKVKQADDDNAHPKSDSTAKVDEKQRAKELWESFLNDVESVAPKSNYAVCEGNTLVAGASESGSKAPKKTDSEKPVPKMFEFAGETVIVDKDLNSSDLMGKVNSEPDVSTEKPPCCQPKRGIDSVLGAIMNKSKKLNVLEKSILDWRKFKNDEGLDNDLEKFNKGKAGFIERQRFLERSDVRSYEKEKSMRQTLRKK